jgi:hypothetical protein
MDEENEIIIKHYLGMQYGLLHAYQSKFDYSIFQILHTMGMDYLTHANEIQQKAQTGGGKEFVTPMQFIDLMGRDLAERIGALPEYTTARLRAMEWK